MKYRTGFYFFNTWTIQSWRLCSPPGIFPWDWDDFPAHKDTHRITYMGGEKSAVTKVFSSLVK